MTNPTLSTQLRRAREKRGMTVEQVAKRLKWGNWYAEAVERAPESNAVDSLRKYARALNCYCIINGPDGAFVVRERQEMR